MDRVETTAPVTPAALALIAGGVLLYWFAEASVSAYLIGGIGFIQVANRFARKWPGRAAKAVHWLRALALEPLALAAVFCSRLFRYVPAYQRPAGRFKGRPLLLVHGYLNSGAVWFFQRTQLKAMGFGPIYTIHLGHPFQSIRTYAEKVKRRAEQIADETGRKDLVLVGHSMGGLVSSYYAAILAPEGTVTDVVTIGSPLGGTPMARLGLGPNAREMEPGSALSKEVWAAVENNRSVRFFHIATRPDLLVMPPSTALPGKDPSRHFVLDDLGHVGLLFSTRVSKLIGNWIGNRFTNPI